MDQSKQHRNRSHRAPVGQMAAAAFALGGLAASLLPAGTAAASTVHAATTATKSVVISALKTKKYGTVLVDGNTLYSLKPSKTGLWDRLPQDMAPGPAAQGRDQSDRRGRRERGPSLVP